MDPFDEDILRTLRGRRPMDFQQILDEVGFSHSTLRLHLNNLMGRGLIVGEKMPSEGPGRPKFTYSTPRRPRRQTSDTQAGYSVMVTLPFNRLRRLCRFQRGGKCRETKDSCKALICPQIQKGE
jgi:DNA-binding Lrp family transcriptional regulator